MHAVIRPATLDDLPAVETFSRALFRETFAYIPYSEENLRRYDEDMLSVDYFSKSMQRGEVLVAHEKDRIAGYTITGPLSLPVEQPIEPNHEIVRLYVHSDYHGAGLAQRFMAHMLAGYENHAIYLSVYCENTRAQRFYKKYGFEKVGEYDYFVGDHTDREWIMCKDANKVTRN